MSYCSQLHKVLNYEDAEKVVTFLEDNQQRVLIGVSAVAAMLLVRMVSGGGKKVKENSQSRRKKKHHKHRKHKNKQQQSVTEALKLDPVDISKLEISTIMREFDNKYEPKIRAFLEKIEERETSKTSKRTDTSVSYKEAFQYKYLYFNESLLKLLMRLDGVETLGKEELRIGRKTCIKKIQEECNKLDRYKVRIENLAKQGVTA
ncbi:hypothetical protein FOA43_002448 [Brettanomyces nanus]|uniref:BAG domain-containing protein n=1 Tax=Eeniella nana TaxID=13502 RepID=A0A875RUZ9_EENNA|nr:uncharacterized protein FOA43_002448 [Brettanomyces nanus]QPG75107.1 hypothetical protein FOA43_002448 [Brettanomyces nanus]